MSANRRLTGISAPKTPILLRPLMHEPQMAGLPGKRAKPTCRSTAPPGPSKGAAQSLQLGPWGRRRMTRRIRARPGSSPERKPRIASSGVEGRGIAHKSYSCARGGHILGTITGPRRSGGAHEAGDVVGFDRQRDARRCRRLAHLLQNGRVRAPVDLPSRGHA